MITLDENIAKVDLSSLKEYCLGGYHWGKNNSPEDDFENLNREPGRCPYKLYAYMSSYYKTIADLGTFLGHSALACALNPDTQVTTYDIDSSYRAIKDKDNIKFVVDDIFNHIDDILENELIILDVDPHDGIQEAKFVEILKQKKYKGVVIADDIHLSRVPGKPASHPMEEWWSNLTCSYKKDITPYGHCQGTGIFKI